jgi:allantoate deiminase
MQALAIDVAGSAARIAADVARLSHPPFTEIEGVIRRWAFTPSYAATDGWVRQRLLSLGYVVEHDAAGSLIGRNTEAGAPAFGLGSHIDSNRIGGPWDGTLGVVCALEIARLNAELDLGLPLRIFAFAEEEGSGFGEVLLGSRVMTGACTESDLRERVRDAEGRSFAEAAEAAGFGPLDLAASRRHLDGLRAWVEIHIEQARQLETAVAPLGNVTVIAGCIQGDLVFSGRADHAGATPMELRRDAFAAAAEVAVALERRAASAGDGTVATVGQVRIEPGQRTTVPARAVLEVDARSTGAGHVVLIEHVVAHAHEVAAGRGLTAVWEQRQQRPPRPLDDRVRAALRDAAAGRWAMLDLASGAVHDTMLIAGLVPAGMVFIPCEGGRSHTPEERADPTHAAQAAEVVLRALVRLVGDDGR